MVSGVRVASSGMSSTQPGRIQCGSVIRAPVRLGATQVERGDLVPAQRVAEVLLGDRPQRLVASVLRRLHDVDLAAPRGWAALGRRSVTARPPGAPPLWLATGGAAVLVIAADGWWAGAGRAVLTGVDVGGAARVTDAVGSASATAATSPAAGRCRAARAGSRGAPRPRTWAWASTSTARANAAQAAHARSSSVWVSRVPGSGRVSAVPTWARVGSVVGSGFPPTRPRASGSPTSSPARARAAPVARARSPRRLGPTGMLARRAAAVGRRDLAGCRVVVMAAPG